METPTLTGDIRARRLAADLSQQELAQRAHCSLASLRLFDRGYRPPNSETLARVEAVLDELERGGERFVPFAEVRDHLELGPTATDGPAAA